MEPFRLPDDFLLGTATAASQVEGVSRDTNWYAWAESGHIRDGTSPLRADDHWNRLEEDTGLLARLGVHTHRLSLEWSRIEPEPGSFDSAALDHYRGEIGMLLEHDIVPLVSLHHFSNPLWFEKNGSWPGKEAADTFFRFASRAVDALKDLVSDWVTINEPNVYLILGHLLGTFPPGHKSFGEFLRGTRNMISAHNRCYDMIREAYGSAGGEPMVGAAHHVRCFDPAKSDPFDRLLTSTYDRLAQDMFIRGMTEGKLIFPLGSDTLWGNGPRSDFFGINYYTRDILAFKFRPRTFFADPVEPKNAEVNDLGWEIYPEGLGRLITRYSERYGLPVWITENGTCDAADSFRTRYLYDHLKEAAKTIQKGQRVERYYHWTFIDNFEWNEGESARFGLYGNDFESQTRTLRRSGEFYSEICRNRGVTREMLSRYLPAVSGR